MSRIISWFSCGAASAVATKLAILNSSKPIQIVRCYLKEEHPDNDRFAKDCEKWFGQPIITLLNDKYNGSVDSVIQHVKFINSPNGAPCTRLLKKIVRQDYQLPNDTHVFGYTVDEQDRFDRFLDANNDLNIWPILIDKNLTHANCLDLLIKQGISLPEMYKLGYKHNNCVGCVKGGMGYWNKIRIDFPHRFEEMAKIERKIGYSCIKGVFLDTLDPTRGHYQKEPEIQCGINCELVEKELYES